MRGTTIRRGTTVPNTSAFTQTGQSWTAAGDKGRVVALSFWASWCGPCKRELPVLDSLLRELDSTDAVRVYAVNVLESPELADAYLASAGLDIPVLYDIDGSIADAFGVTALPTLVVINRDSEVRWVEVGYQPWNIKELAQVVDEMVPGAFGEVPPPEDIIFERLKRSRDTTDRSADSVIDTTEPSESTS